MVPVGFEGFYLTLQEDFKDFIWYVEFHWLEEDFYSHNYFIPINNARICIPKSKDFLVDKFLRNQKE